MGINKDRTLSAAAEMRRRAQDRLPQESPQARPLLTEHERLKLVHEIEIHQIELEMQNEELRLARNELEAVNAALAVRTAELETANADLEAFNYTVCHDLRTPLTAINGYCQVVQQLCGNRLNEECRHYIREMYKGTLQMKDLIISLLDFSRVTRVTLFRETVYLSALARELAAELKLTALERRVTFLIAEGIAVNGDAGLLRIVLNNLMGNAWKHSGNMQDTVIEFGVTEVDGKPACFIRDNGPGFDMADAGKLFLPFQRLPGTAIEGSGIGLATVDRIVRRHGGRVWAESEPGKGATFLFTLE